MDGAVAGAGAVVRVVLVSALAFTAPTATLPATASAPSAPVTTQVLRADAFIVVLLVVGGTSPPLSDHCRGP
jgi:hypothetical protein